MTSTAPSSSISNVFKYEVLYYKRSNKFHKPKGSSQLDGILSIETKSSLVTLAQPYEEQHHYDNNNINGDTSSTSDDCSSSSSDDDDDNDGESVENNSKLSKSSKEFQKQKLKKLRQKLKKKNEKNKKNKKKKANHGGISHTCNKKQSSYIYSAVNSGVAKSVLEKGGLNIDDIVILPQWECQIVNSITDRKVHNGLASKCSQVTTTSFCLGKGLQSTNNKLGAFSKQRTLNTLNGKTSNLVHNNNISRIPKDQKDISTAHKPVSSSTNLVVKRKFPFSSISSCKNSTTSHSISLLDKTSMEPKHDNRILSDTKRLKVRHISTTSTSVTSSSSNTSFPGAIGSIQAPNSIKSILRPHQIEGIVFLWNCLTGASSALQQVLNSRRHNVENEKLSSSQHSLNGAILADEMGLGKTLMTITVLFSLHRRNRNDVS